MSRKDILEEASSEDIEYLKAIMNKKSISKENDSFMKNSGNIINSGYNFRYNTSTESVLFNLSP